MQLKKKDMDRVFTKLRVQDVASTHHVTGKATTDSGRTVRLRYSHGRGDIPMPVAHRIRRQLMLSLPEFAKLVECTLSRDEWARLADQRAEAGRQ